MIDFKLNNNGDLVLNEQEQLPPFCVKWHVSDYPLFQIKFVQDSITKRNEPENSLRIDFKTSNFPGGNNKKCLTTRDIEVIKQKLIILFRTEYGEIKSQSTFGSKIMTMRHKNINLQDTINKVQQIVEDEIADIIDDPIVIVKRKIYDGPFYCQNLNIYIYQKDELLYEFDLEV